MDSAEKQQTDGSVLETGAAPSVRRLLLVDEHPGLADTLLRLLDPGRFACEQLRTGLDALCRITEQPPHLVLADMACPELDGFQLCALLKSRPAFRDIPVVLLSRRHDLFERLRAEALGAAAVLALPFSREELRQGLEASLPHDR